MRNDEHAAGRTVRVNDSRTFFKAGVRSILVARMLAQGRTSHPSQRHGRRKRQNSQIGNQTRAIGVRPFDMYRSSKRVAHDANRTPHHAVTVASIMLSISNWRINRGRTAPSASFIANSGRRAAARANSKLSVLAHAITTNADHREQNE